MIKTAFLFPGQGSQSVGMMSALADEFSLVRDTFDEASKVLGYDLWSLTTDGPKDELNKTEVTQPAMLVAGISTLRVWQHLGGFQPDFYAGHSLGEYTALVASGVIDFKDAVAIVAKRGQLMQQVTPVGMGAMAAVHGLEDKVVRDICSQVESGEVVSCANYNAPGQVVISGDREAVMLAGELAMKAGAHRVLPLPLNVPLHCRLMKTAAAYLQDVLLHTHFSESSIPVIQNADVRAYSDAEQVREALARQLWQPVRWTETIADLMSSGVSRFVECGPGKMLTGFNQIISKESAVFALTDSAAMKQAMQVEDE